MEPSGISAHNTIFTMNLVMKVEHFFGNTPLNFENYQKHSILSLTYFKTYHQTEVLLILIQKIKPLKTPKPIGRILNSCIFQTPIYIISSYYSF